MLVEAGDVRLCAVQSPLEFVSFKQELVPLGKKVLVLLAETVAIFLDPGAVRLSQLSQQVAYELARNAYEADGRRIVDATVGGKLTIFPKGDLDTALHPIDR